MDEATTAAAVRQPVAPLVAVAPVDLSRAALTCWRRRWMHLITDTGRRLACSAVCERLREERPAATNAPQSLSNRAHGARVAHPHHCAQRTARRTPPLRTARRRCAQLTTYGDDAGARRETAKPGWLRSGRVWGARWVSRCGQAANPMRGPPCMCKPRFGAAMPLIAARRGL